jgi:predicted glutamine amidotransferase
MGRLFGIMSNRADRLREELREEREALVISKDPAPDAWGLGFYQGGEVLHKKRPQLAGESLDWPAIAGDIRSTCVIGHARFATCGELRSENTHPFRFRHWLFAHHGTIERFAAIEPRLKTMLPDYLRRNIRGETDSEHLMHVLLSFLDEEGQLEQPDVDEKRVLQAVRATVRVVDRWCEEVEAPSPTLNVVFSNGRHMFALRRGAPMAYVVRQGLREVAGGEGARHDRNTGSIRYGCVVSGAPATPAEYSALDNETLLTFDRDANVRLVSL